MKIAYSVPDGRLVLVPENEPEQHQIDGLKKVMREYRIDDSAKGGRLEIALKKIHP